MTCKLLLYFMVLLSFRVILSIQKEEWICNKCSAPKEASYLREFCKNENTTGYLAINGSCCLNLSLTAEMAVRGLDMSDCGLTNIHGLLNYCHNLNVLMLEENDKLILKPEDFKGLSNLAYLSLPSTSDCPGGPEAWETIDKGHNSTICHHEINMCDHHNVTCLSSTNSHCMVMSPGKTECLCDEGYHGYKCLREGMFPYAYFSTIISVVTVVLSVFLWCTQRRKVKKVHH